MANQKVIKIYNTLSGEEPFNEWFKKLKDVTIKARILRRIDRLEFNNYGVHRYLSGGLFELKFDIGPGYRVYCGEEGNQLVVLLCAGDKSSQSRDIEKAKNYWKDYLNRR